MASSRFSIRPHSEIERAMQACRTSLAIIFGLSFFINLLALTVPLYLLQIYDHVLSSRSVDTLVMLTIIVVAALAVHGALEALRREMLSRIGLWLADRLQAPVLAAAVSAAMRDDVTGATQAWRDVRAMRSFFAGSAATSLVDLPWTPIFVLAMLLVHPLLGLIGLVGSVVLFGLAVANDIATRKPVARASVAWANSQHRLEALLRNAQAISAMGMLPGVARLMEADRTQAKEAELCAGRWGSAIQAASRFGRLLTQVVVMAVAAWLVIARDISPAAIFACSILLGRSLGPVESAIGTWRAVTSVRLGYRRLQKIVAAAPPPAASMAMPAPQGALSIEQVVYAPPGGDGAVLKRISLTLGPGEILGIVGPSGAGKSTLGRLVAGTIRPTAGHVRLDGADIAIWLASGGHGHIGYLPQDIELIGGSVRDNISRLGDADPEQVIGAASLVGLHEAIMRLRDGYDTDIGEGGCRLSGGQRQRLGLARAFFGEPRLVVLDEPNANLDADGEDALRHALERMRAAGTTIIVIAQRLGILEISDKILVMDNGVINAFGARRAIISRIKRGDTAIPVRKRLIDARRTRPAIVQDVAEAPARCLPGPASTTVASVMRQDMS